MSFREVLSRERPLVLPGAHDALSALLIERAGFRAYVIGGFALVGARYGLPDLGLAGFGEIRAGVADIVAACGLPALVDCDNGYGDEKTAVRTLHAYERLGLDAFFFEDQASPKRCGHLTGKRLVPTAQMERLVATLAGEKRNPETFLIARTDAIAVEGLDAALGRAERYLAAGADGLFVEGPRDLEELRRVGEAFDVPLVANMVPGGQTPVLATQELADLNFAIVLFPIDLLMHSAAAMDRALGCLAGGEPPDSGAGMAFADYLKVVGLDDWGRLEADRTPR